MLENAILMLMGLLRGAPMAIEPSPAIGEKDVARNSVLSWTPGDLVETHDVYFGTNFVDVNDASRANPSGVLRSQGQSNNTYVPMDPLEFGRTYFWRIDEVTAPPDSTVFKGEVWSFTGESFALQVGDLTSIASSSAIGKGSENTVNGSGLDADDLHSTEDGAMWLSDLNGAQPTWIEYQFDKPYMLHEIWVWNHNGAYEQTIGLGARDVTIEYSQDGANYETLGASHEFAQAPGAPGYAHNTTVDFGGTTATDIRLMINSNWGGIFTQYGLSEVRFYYIPTYARRPYPDSGATDVDLDTVLTWRAGREAAEHKIYIDTHRQAITDGTAPAATLTEASYGPLSLDLGTTYYWRVEEANIFQIPAKWTGDIWNFTTRDYLVVDDFESYNDLAEEQEGSNLVYQTWVDGFETATNGSTIGYVELFQPPMETGIVHSGSQSVPLVYDNSVASLSEVSVNPASLTVGGDWTKGSPQTLVLWFYGDPGNAVTEQMYVKINGIKVVYPGAATDIAEATWKRFSIDLAALGIDLSNVAQLTIGFERTGQMGGTGIVFIDDILLYRLAPEITVP